MAFYTDSKKTKPSASFRQANSAGQASLSAVIASSRATGTLNLSSRALDQVSSTSSWYSCTAGIVVIMISAQVPPAVYNHDDALPGSDTNWWEVSCDTAFKARLRTLFSACYPA